MRFWLILLLGALKWYFRIFQLNFQSSFKLVILVLGSIVNSNSVLFSGNINYSGNCNKTETKVIYLKIEKNSGWEWRREKGEIKVGGKRQKKRKKMKEKERMNKENWCNQFFCHQLWWTIAVLFSMENNKNIYRENNLRFIIGIIFLSLFFSSF